MERVRPALVPGKRQNVRALCRGGRRTALFSAAGKMIFLYEEEQEDVAYARENAKVPVVVLYNEATPYHIWWRSQELMEYDRIYFASQGNKERITDGVICGSGKLIVYAADYDTKEESLRMILESNEGLKDYRLVSQRSLWSVYEFE